MIKLQQNFKRMAVDPNTDANFRYGNGTVEVVVVPGQNSRHTYVKIDGYDSSYMVPIILEGAVLRGLIAAVKRGLPRRVRRRTS